MIIIEYLDWSYLGKQIQHMTIRINNNLTLHELRNKCKNLISIHSLKKN